MARKKQLTEKEFESLLTKASQPLPAEEPLKPDSKEAETSELKTSDGCSETNTRQDSSEGT